MPNLRKSILVTARRREVSVHAAMTGAAEGKFKEISAAYDLLNDPEGARV
jgi:curved DNA-binding protein CbpA